MTFSNRTLIESESTESESFGSLISQNYFIFRYSLKNWVKIFVPRGCVRVCARVRTHIHRVPVRYTTPLDDSMVIWYAVRPIRFGIGIVIPLCIGDVSQPVFLPQCGSTHSD